MAELLQYLNKKVFVIAVDGRTWVGTMLTCDVSCNIVLSNAVERKIAPEGIPSEEIPIGGLLVRGDTLALCGLVDEEMDASINWEQVNGEIIGTTKHTQ